MDGLAFVLPPGALCGHRVLQDAEAGLPAEVLDRYQVRCAPSLDHPYQLGAT